MKFRQHVPAFVDGVDPLQLNDVTIEDILNKYKHWNQGQDEFAYYYSLIGLDDFEYKAHLMCQWKEEDKYHWYVLGYMSEIPSSLKEWVCPESNEEVEEYDREAVKNSDFYKGANKIFADCFASIIKNLEINTLSSEDIEQIKKEKMKGIQR